MKTKFSRLISCALCILISSAISVTASIPASALSYSGSSSYKSGKYYRALTKVSLTGNPATDIVNIAKSQIGYQESSSSSRLSGEVRGDKNCTEYGRWYGMQDMWCQMFVSWCAYVAKVPTSVIAKTAGTVTGLEQFMNQGRAHSRSSIAAGKYTPKKGDIVYFKSSRNNKITNHVGIVTSYSGGTLYTIEGNTSSATISTDGGAVCSKSYKISNTYIVYVCNPKYTGTQVTTYKTGVYKVTADTLNIRSGAGTSYGIVGRVTAGKQVAVTSVKDGWGKVNVGGVSGYIKLSYTSYVKALKYTVKFNANGGTGTMANQSFTYGTAKALSANAFKRTGYTFKGWSKSATATTATYTNQQAVKNLTSAIDGTVTLYAVWAKNSYTVKFNANGGAGTMANQSFTYGSSQALTANAFKRTGYTFKGWAKSATATTVAYTNKQTVNNLTATANGTVTLYAVWAKNSYTVKFNANGGAGTMANQSFTYDTAKALTANAFTRSGYTFKGWAKSATATTAAYTNKQTVKNLTSTANGTVTLYAVWAKNSIYKLGVYAVNTDALNVRSGAGTSYSPKGTVVSGNLVVVTSVIDDYWGKIEFNGSTGYVSMKYLTYKNAAKYKVTADSLNVRKGPATTYDSLGVVHKDATYTITAIRNGWAKINYNGTVGWVSMKYLVNI